MPNPDQCRFTKTHEWVLVEGNAGTVGISDHAQHEITDVVFVELPKAGRKVKQGEAVAVVESVKAAFDIYAPVSGEILEVHSDLLKDVASINQSPYEGGWLFKVKIASPGEVDSLMTHSRYQEFIKQGS
ncbi:MAG: glycine cleavage system protein GcvH [Elusimicrobia bacterium]|nr:glycine cleavage system protein GcvH [Elusimicrobiota bacterium]